MSKRPFTIKDLQKKLLRTYRKRIHPHPGNPRSAIDAASLTGLISSLKAIGQQTPLIGRPHPTIPDEFELLDGHRRLASFAAADIDEVDILVLYGEIDDNQVLAAQLSLGATNEKLNPYELADGAAKLMRNLSITQEEAAEIIGVTSPTISRAKGITAHLAEQLKPDVEAGVIGFTLAEQLIRLKDFLPYQIELADLVKKGALNRTSLGRRIDTFLQDKAGKQPKPRPVAFKNGKTKAETTSEDAEAVVASFAAFIAAIRSAQKAGIQNPVRNAPQFLKQQP